MTIVRNRFVVLCLLSMLFVCVRSAGRYDLKCEMLTNSLKIDNTNSHFSWKIGEAGNNYIQDSYQIMVSSSKKLLDACKGDLWNTGRVKSGESIWIICKGKKLKSRDMAYWKLRIWNTKGEIEDGNNMLPDLTRRSLENMGWCSVKELEIPVKKCSPQISEVNKIEKTIHSISITALKDTTWAVDMGETGWTRIVFHQLSPLKKISMNYSNCLNKASFLNNLDNIDYYIASDKKEESFIGCRHGVIASVRMADYPIRHLSLTRQVTLVG